MYVTMDRGRSPTMNKDDFVAKQGEFLAKFPIFKKELIGPARMTSFWGNEVETHFLLFILLKLGQKTDFRV